jgi:tRNA(Ile)-lysidine synthase
MIQPIWTLYHAQLAQTIRTRQLLPAHQRLLVAVSGGQDSLCLIRLLLDLQPKWQWQLAIAHCNHRWRDDSTQNAAYVQELAQTWQILFHGVTAENVPTSEASARSWRYQALTEIAQHHDYAYVVTGHTASDRAETLLYNLVRGSGSDGLQALTWRRSLTENIVLVRPLLNMTRRETAQFCQMAHLKVWEDTTNQSLHYARNRIREELIPYLQTHFNPQAEQALAQTAELLRAEVDYLESVAQVVFQQVVDPNTVGKGLNWRLNRVILHTSPLAIQRRVIRQFLQQILPIAPTFEHIEKCLSLLTAPNRTQTDPFPGGAIAQVQGDWIEVQPYP